jgi:hypothetical protein
MTCSPRQSIPYCGLRPMDSDRCAAVDLRGAEDGDCHIHGEGRLRPTDFGGRPASAALGLVGIRGEMLFTFTLTDASGPVRMSASAAVSLTGAVVIHRVGAGALAGIHQRSHRSGDLHDVGLCAYGAAGASVLPGTYSFIVRFWAASPWPWRWIPRRLALLRSPLGQRSGAHLNPAMTLIFSAPEFDDPSWYAIGWACDPHRRTMTNLRLTRRLTMTTAIRVFNAFASARYWQPPLPSPLTGWRTHPASFADPNANTERAVHPYERDQSILPSRRISTFRTRRLRRGVSLIRTIRYGRRSALASEN